MPGDAVGDETSSQHRVLEDPHAGHSEGSSVVSEEEVVAVACPQAGGADCGRNHRDPVRPCLEDLQASTSTEPDGHDGHVCPLELGGEIGHLADDIYARMRSESSDPVTALTHDTDLRTRDGLADPRKHFADEP